MAAYNKGFEHTSGDKLIRNRTGLVVDEFYVAGCTWSPVYVLDGDTPVLFEAGFHCMGKHYERDIGSICRGREPGLLFLTHSHWDHCGAAAYLKKVYPGLRVAASRQAAEIVQRPNARKLMVAFSQDLISRIESTADVERELLIRGPFEPFEVDVLLEDGQEIAVSDNVTVQVFAAPGHTRDMLCYFLPEKRILMASEAVGCLEHTGRLVTEFLVDYDAYVASLKRLALLDIEVLCQGHYFVFVGDDVRSYLDRSIKAAEEFKENVLMLLQREDGSVERVVTRIKAEEYDMNQGIRQPEEAYLVNLRQRVSHLAERLGHHKNS
jgi:2-aminobenzoylacetyl-CoA thioesterase